MAWFGTFLTSSIGRKFVMALTGLFLISFLVVHCGINATIFVNDGGETFNKAAHFMGTNLLIRTMEIGLFVGLLLHIVQGLLIWQANRSKRPVRYAASAGNSNSRWYSRSMGLLGTLILLFLIIHLVHFWIPSRFTGVEPIIIAGVEHHNLYALMQHEFSEWWVVVIYTVGVVSLCWHLLHGFASAFQTFGWVHHKYNSLIKGTGVVFSIVVSLLFASMPIAMFLGIVK
jgi:succinate dehydrogenase / fumarate reductase cytochrome b subunit